MIEVQDLTVRYGTFALRDVSFVLRAGERLAVLGPSGAGKTLLLETVMGARRPDRGRVLIDGREMTRVPPEARRIAYIPQDLALFPHLTVLENLRFGLRGHAARRASAGAIEEVVSMLGLEPLLARRDVATLSGGERQRLALGRALVVRPRVLFLDEPFASLDAATRTDLQRSLRAIVTRLGTTVFLVTHAFDEAFLLADGILLMMQGRIVQRGPAAAVFRGPRTVDAARFLNIRNILRLERIPAETAAALVRGRPPQAPPAHVAIRPEDVEIRTDRDGPGGADGGPGLVARVVDLFPAGSRVTVIVELADGGRIEASMPSASVASAGITGGAPIRVHLPAASMIALAEGA
ncbi:MAG: ABC transporter ATP-binding protein [Phycisphaeraceae bacterium]|nr:ABC transporter ATP-binding protein [Phycisphaeraceae bacterium]